MKILILVLAMTTASLGVNASISKSALGRENLPLTAVAEAAPKALRGPASTNCLQKDNKGMLASNQYTGFLPNEKSRQKGPIVPKSAASADRQ